MPGSENLINHFNREQTKTTKRKLSSATVNRKHQPQIQRMLHNFLHGASGTITPQSSRHSPEPDSDGMNTSNNTPPPTTITTSRTPPRKRIVVAITGATGALLGIKTLIALRALNIETHLIMSKWAEATIKYETDYHPSNIKALADYTHNISDMAAPVSSGSFKTDGMIVVPCSMKTLAAIHAGFCDDLISRTADVMLKERRRLVLIVRETPLSEIHLRNMLEVTRAGAVIAPPVPAFYIKPGSVEDLIDQSVGRMLDLFGLDTEGFERWEGWKKV